MKRIKLLSALAALTFLIVSCTAATPAAPAMPTQPPPLPTVPVTVEPTSTLASGAPQTEADVPRVSVEDAAAAIQKGEAIVVDVRSAQAYQASHIPGALSIPLFDIESNPAGVNLEKDKWIITYCT
ncbi:MAG: rhodanese-like domain-containing protein [Bacteroidota bacterium]